MLFKYSPLYDNARTSSLWDNDFWKEARNKNSVCENPEDYEVFEEDTHEDNILNDPLVWWTFIIVLCPIYTIVI